MFRVHHSERDWRRIRQMGRAGALVLLLAGLIGSTGCETRVIQDNSFAARLQRSMPAGSVQMRRGRGTYRVSPPQGQPVPANSIPNAATPDNWINGFRAASGP